MCGIAGIVALDGSGHHSATPVAMRDVIAPSRSRRGRPLPDAHAALAHRRLSIVDLRTAATAAANEDGRSGSSSTARSTTTPRSAGARGGTATLPDAHPTPRRSFTPTRSGATTASHRFRGMFAFAIWDAPSGACCSRATALASSRSTGRGAAPLLFGSEIKAILASGLVGAEANVAVVPEVAQHPLHRRRRYAVPWHSQLLPGHVLVFEGGAITTRAVLGRAAASATAIGTQP